VDFSVQACVTGSNIDLHVRPGCCKRILEVLNFDDPIKDRENGVPSRSCHDNIRRWSNLWNDIWSIRALSYVMKCNWSSTQNICGQVDWFWTWCHIGFSSVPCYLCRIWECLRDHCLSWPRIKHAIHINSHWYFEEVSLNDINTVCAFNRNCLLCKSRISDHIQIGGTYR
jgi:hypothetical protein